MHRWTASSSGSGNGCERAHVVSETRPLLPVAITAPCSSIAWISARIVDVNHASSGGSGGNGTAYESVVLGNVTSIGTWRPSYSSGAAQNGSEAFPRTACTLPLNRY